MATATREASDRHAIRRAWGQRRMSTEGKTELTEQKHAQSSSSPHGIAKTGCDCAEATFHYALLPGQCGRWAGPGKPKRLNHV